VGGAAQSLAQVPPPESAEVSQPQTGPISGYMDFHFNKPESQDGESVSEFSFHGVLHAQMKCYLVMRH